MTDGASMNLGILVLAAGKGTRMKSDTPKALHGAAGRSLMEWTFANLGPLDASQTVVVVGDGAAEVIREIPHGIAHAVQDPQIGTGDAVRVGLEAFPDSVDTILVMPVDMPLLRPSTVQQVLTTQSASGHAATVLAAIVGDPAGYGRVLRDGESIVGIVEEGDAAEDQLAIREINTSVYAFDRSRLETALGGLDTDNSQGEYYLTDVIRLLAAAGETVGVVVTDESESLGVNDHAELAAAGAELRRRINERLMADGVAMVDPSRVYVDAGVRVAPGARLYPDVYLQGSTTVGTDAEIGPNVHATDTAIGDGAVVRWAVLDRASVGSQASVGPFTHLRPEAELRERTKAGAFVEIKKSVVGPGSKVPHLSYVGDTDIGEGSNIGAGTITVNYDGFEKHRTTIGDRVRIGSDTMLIAPVEIGDDAYTGAGSVITEDVAPGALALERSPQQEIEGYSERRKRRAAEDLES
jgi:bifunctional UDP-N-acetylglucosamine pyrophosphorylase/glucosamine-1-phosphate N-acetyltransferase